MLLSTLWIKTGCDPCWSSLSPSLHLPPTLDHSPPLPLPISKNIALIKRLENRLSPPFPWPIGTWVNDPFVGLVSGDWASQHISLLEHQFWTRLGLEVADEQWYIFKLFLYSELQFLFIPRFHAIEHIRFLFQKHTKQSWFPSSVNFSWESWSGFGGLLACALSTIQHAGPLQSRVFNQNGDRQQWGPLKFKAFSFVFQVLVAQFFCHDLGKHCAWWNTAPTWGNSFGKDKWSNWSWWLISVRPVSGRLRQEDCYAFPASQPPWVDMELLTFRGCMQNRKTRETD